LYFNLQALLFVKRTSSISSLIEAAGLSVKGNAVAGPTRKVTADTITIERTIYGSPQMTGDALMALAMLGFRVAVRNFALKAKVNYGGRLACRPH
jgi:L-amino acid N-acyltransferase YncA